MSKGLISLIVIASFLFTGFCFAADNTVQSFLDQYLPVISEYWNKTLNWIENDLKPWIGENIGQKTKEEFSNEFSEAVKDVPETIKNVWNDIMSNFN